MADSRIDELRRRLERDPGSRLFAQLAEELRKAGELEEAIGVARAGLEQHPAYPSARLTLGRALLDSGDPAAARVELGQAVRGAPDNILANRLLGEALETLGELGAAVKQYETTLLMAPGDRHVESRLRALRVHLAIPAPPAGERAPEVTAPVSAVDRRAVGEERVAPARVEAPGERAEPPRERVETPEEEERPPPTIRIRAAGEPPLRVQPAPGAPGRAGAQGPDASRVRAAPSGERPPTPAGPATPTGPPPVGERAGAPPQGRGAPAEARPKEETTLPGGERPRTAEAGPTSTQTETEEAVASVREAPPSREPPTESPPLPETAEDDSDLAPTLPKAEAPTEATEEELAPTIPPQAMIAGDTERQEGAARPHAVEPSGRSGGPEAQAAAGMPGAPPTGGTKVPSGLSSATLAELYFQQGLLERAVEVYRQVLEDDPANEGARRRLAEVEALVEAGASGLPVPPPPGAGEDRAGRRQALERTIELLERLLAVVQRR